MNPPKPPRQNLWIRRGDDWGDGVTLQCGDGSGTPLDITGAKIWLTIRDVVVRDAEATDETHPPIVQISSPAVGGDGGITVTDGPNGEASPVITRAQTKLLIKQRYSYDVQIEPATGPLAGNLKTLQDGSIEILDEQTLSV